jgi:DNA-binding NarL/FixJ family response regulator
MDAVREHPDVLPVSELTDLARRGVQVTVDRSGPESIVWVANAPDGRFSELTPREREVAALVAVGLTNRTIAHRLFISVATTKDHVHAILTKTGCETRAEVAAAWHGGTRA